MSAAEILSITFTEDGQNLVSVKSLALALVILVLLIRIFYVQKRLDQLQREELKKDLTNWTQSK
jgi:hypothetical protein